MSRYGGYCERHYQYDCLHQKRARELRVRRRQHAARIGVGAAGLSITAALGTGIYFLVYLLRWWVLIGIMGVFATVLLMYAYGWMLSGAWMLLDRKRTEVRES